jgi:dienelactone hydrolase
MHYGIRYSFIIVIALTICVEIRAEEAKPLSPEAYKVLTYFYQYDKNPDLEVHVVHKMEYEDHFREKIVFRSFRGDWVNGYIGIPKEGTAPYPCVIILHGGGYYSAALWDQGDPRSYDIMHNYIQSGFAVLALDAQYHGERKINSNFDSVMKMLEEKRYNQIRNLNLNTVTDYRQAFDYLETRPEIDSSHIAAHGYSMGGIMAFLLTALDPRIKVCVTCAAPISTFPAVVWSPYFFAHDVDDCAMLMLMGNKDPWYTVEDAQKTFDLIPSATKELKFYDSGHILPREYEKKAHDWLKKHLK